MELILLINSSTWGKRATAAVMRSMLLPPPGWASGQVTQVLYSTSLPNKRTAERTLLVCVGVLPERHSQTHTQAVSIPLPHKVPEASNAVSVTGILSLQSTHLVKTEEHSRQICVG